MPGEHAGLFADIMDHDGVAFDVVNVYENQALPAAADYDCLMVLGGAQQVWQTDEHPWLGAEIDYVRRWVTEERKPYFGLCLGHQMLAEALGGEVGMAAQPELGFPMVKLLPGAKQHPLISLLPEQSHWLQWHEAEVKKAPESLSVLASSEHSAIQVMAGDNGVFSLQFHAEGNPSQIDRWTIEGDAMRKDHGETEVARVRLEAEQHLPKAMKIASNLFRRWLVTYANLRDQ